MQDVTDELGQRKFTKEGKPIFELNLTKYATENTVIEEVGHLIRGMSTKEELAGFVGLEGLTGTSGAMWTSDIRKVGNTFWLGNQEYEKYNDAYNAVVGNEEVFAEMFRRYLANGYAPNAQVKSVFDKIIEFAKKIGSFISGDRYKNAISEEAKNAFNSLIAKAENRAGNEIGEGIGPAFSVNGKLDRDIQADYDRVYNELKTNPKNWDGQHWLAPNGKISNLTERQYIQVRTPAFIKWFGDWLNFGIKQKLTNLRAITISTKIDDVPLIFRNSNSEDRKARVDWAYNQVKTKKVQSVIGEVEITKSGINDSLFKGHNVYKASLFSELDSLISNSVLLKRNQDDNGDIQYILGSKFIRNNELDDSFVGIVIKEDSKGNKYYTHTILQKNNQTAKSQSENQNDTPTLHLDVSSILGNILSVNDSEVSKVLDENGEPRVVYHGSSNGNFEVFDYAKIGSATDDGLFGTGFYFSTSEKTAEQYGDARAFFLNFKNPLFLGDYTTETKVEELRQLLGAEKSDIRYSDYLGVASLNYFYSQHNFNSDLSRAGFDGVVVNYKSTNPDVEFQTSWELVALNPNQIKSATDNNGAFSRENDSILFSVNTPVVNINSDITSEERKRLADDIKTSFGYHKVGNVNVADGRETGPDAGAFETDFQLADMLSTLGAEVYMLPEFVTYNQTEKRPDFLVNDHIVEGKRNNLNKFGTRFREATKQAHNVFIDVTEKGITRKQIEDSLNGKVLDIIRSDKELRTSLLVRLADRNEYYAYSIDTTKNENPWVLIGAPDDSTPSNLTLGQFLLGVNPEDSYLFDTQFNQNRTPLFSVGSSEEYFNNDQVKRDIEYAIGYGFYIRPEYAKMAGVEAEVSGKKRKCK